MTEQLRKSAELAAANFDAFLGDRTAKVQVKVFLCGKALAQAVSIQEQVEVDIRAYLLTRLETEVGCNVFLGEHNRLIRTYYSATGNALPEDQNLDDVNLCLFEASLADYVDLIVIFPDSPGSFAELGMFSVAPGVCPKLLLMIKAEHEGTASFINRGPIKAARNNRAQVEYIDYSDRETIFRVVRAEIVKIRETLAAQDVWQRKSHK
jgi:hypothetical protein